MLGLSHRDIRTRLQLPRFLPDGEVNLTFLDSVSARDKHPHHKEALVLSCSFLDPLDFNLDGLALLVLSASFIPSGRCFHET